MVRFIFQVHTLFSLLGLNHAYITNRGELMGVISIKEVCHFSKNFLGFFKKSVRIFYITFFEIFAKFKENKYLFP